jgi:D-alanine-D-alanine ligase
MVPPMGEIPHSVVVVHNIPRSSEAARPRSWVESDAGVLDEVGSVAAALVALEVPHRCAGIRRLDDLATELAIAPENVVFNLVESLEGDVHDFNLVPAVCSAASKGCTGSDSGCLIRCFDKWQARAALRAYGIPTPQAVVATGVTEVAPDLPDGTVIVKPLLCDASEGIGADSVFSEAGAALLERVRSIEREFGCPALIEEFIEGREINVSVLQTESGPEVLPLAEIDFRDFKPDRPRIVDYRAKWLPESFEYQNTVRLIPAPLPDQVADEVRHLALRAWAAVGCRDYARVDFRLDADLRPFVLEVNANPDISPEGGFAAALEAAGISYGSFVRQVVGNALARICERMPTAVQAEAPGPGTPFIRRTASRDRAVLLRMLARTGAFRPDEVAVAREVLDDALAQGEDGHYQSYTAEADGQPVGWICFGPTPCTLGTFDIYWVAVDPQAQRNGIGRALMEHAEDLIAGSGGRLTVIETSGRATNEYAERFYVAVGYQESARIADFYAPGDDKVVYTRRLTSGPRI